MRLTRFLIAAAIGLSVFTAVSGRSYSSEFSEAISVDEPSKSALDSILSQWINQDPDEPDLAVAKFQRLLLDPYKPTVTKSRNKDADNDTTYIIAINRVIDEEIIKKAYAIIDEAIEKNPDLFRLREQKLAVDYNMDFNEELIKDFDNAFSRQVQNHGNWNAERSYFADTPGDQIVARTAVTYISDILEKDHIDFDFVEELINTGLRYFPDEYRLLNIYGAVEGFYKHDTEAGVRYFEKALAIAPDDVFVLLNFAHLKVSTGDDEGAIELANRVIASDTSEEYKDVAREIIEYANHEKVPVSLYSFEFKYTPVLAAKAENPFQLTNVGAIIEELLPAEGYIPQFSSDIVSDSVVTVNGKECVLWTFSDPTETPLCKYLVFIPADNGYDIYTLEKTLPLQDDINWVIGQPSASGHSSFGGVKGFENGEEFVKFVIDNFVK